MEPFSDVYQKFQSHLDLNERILWTGQPDPKELFVLIDLFLVPFSLLWGGMAVYFQIGIFTSRGSWDPIGILFMLVGVYFVIGRFIYKWWRKRRTYYALTDHRIMMLIEIAGKRFRALDLRYVSAVDKRVWKSGTGSLLFNSGKSSIFSTDQFWTNTGMDVFLLSPTHFGFFDIANAEDVFRQINAAKRDLL